MTGRLPIVLRRMRDDDSGVAMLTVIGVILLMTIIAIGAFTYAQQNVVDSQRIERQTQAFQAANSAADNALTRIQENGFRLTDYPLTGTSSTGATYTATVAPTANSEYICTATGTDPSGRTETIKIKFFYLNMWNMNLAAGTNNALGGGSVKGTTSVYGPFYVRGGVALGANSTIENGPLFIKGGDLTISGSGQIGGNGSIDVYVTGAYPTPGSKGMNSRSVSQSVPDITLPVVDMSVMTADYLLAKNESFDNIQGYADSAISNQEASGGTPSTYTTLFGAWTRPKAPGASTFYKVVGADGGIGALAAGTHPLTIGGTGSWGAGSGDGHYSLSSHDDFMYNDATNVLTVDGTVFIDGPLTLNDNITYRGNGTVIVNGDITMNGSFKPNTPTNYPDATHVVGLVTPGNFIVNFQGSNNKDPVGTPDIAGAFFASKDWSMTGNGLFVKGSVLAGSISFNHPNQHLVTDPDLPSYLPRSLPGAGNSILTRGSWVR